MSRTIDHFYIAEGLLEDCEELFLRCSQVSRLSYEKFCDIWKEFDFVCIFHKRRTGAELAEFSEEALQIAKFYMVSQIDDYEKSVAGLFLVYALLNLQPFPKFAALRIVQEDVPAIKQLELVARRERRIDILYILGEVLIKGPCQFHVSARERALDFCFRKYFDGYVKDICFGHKSKGVFQKHNEEIDLMKDISMIEERYKHVKTNLPVDPNNSLTYVNPNLVLELQNSLRTIVSGLVNYTPIEVTTPEEKNSTDENTTKEDDRGESIQSIKSKALKNAVNPMRHLTGVFNKSPEASTLKNKTPPKANIGSKYKNKCRRASDSPEPFKSPTKIPWAIKTMFSNDINQLSIFEHTQNSPEDIAGSTLNDNVGTESNKDMVLIDLEPVNDKFHQPENSENISKCQPKNTPHKKPTTKEKIDIIDRRKGAQDDKDCQFIELSIDKIPKEISINKNIEFEIIDEFKGVQSTSTLHQASTSKEIMQPSKKRKININKSGLKQKVSQAIQFEDDEFLDSD